MLRHSPLLRFRLSAVRLAGGSNPKPTWSIPDNQRFEPQIPDRYYYSHHWFLDSQDVLNRKRKEQLEFIFSSVSYTLNYYTAPAIKVVSDFVDQRAPDIRYKVILALAAFGAFSLCTHYSSALPEELGRLESLHQLLLAKRLDEQGFWRSASEDQELRTDQMMVHSRALQESWEAALQEATETRDFSVLCKAAVDVSDAPDLPETSTLRFDLLPYGADNPDTQAFPHAKHEWAGTPTLGASGHGDYINRVDSKTGTMRHARSLYADVYVGPTK
uniref:Uncharacterized protein n=1 Tax=Chromera velia CCMP2878 TaxID=1169474 RepID=A0A0G4GXB3_9ALVE|mmetsp:Transcript_49907/g.98349  ORF Transcript_49907/g.98349 Transcript_49907/m.98349 type:complete len:273 (-) Transcript_49907:75-893(-)|eukprot:Cvel_23801.t1-p1 / transcript=Cvel_23801.t1 / gene=Cvel_23801 / organism=Chromera_velia_CCMP2878 / gene_product=hypothetical protein / transcript_product=hypothetical protein / location=Cvel_scaffold2498:25596-26411(+) / protein_length=272 / sequence_SO=supercontig / SO=protein_coding / is_pseudo=false